MLYGNAIKHDLKHEKPLVVHQQKCIKTEISFTLDL